MSNLFSIYNNKLRLFGLCIIVFRYRVKMQRYYTTIIGLRTGNAGTERINVVARVSHFHKMYLLSIMFIYSLCNGVKCRIYDRD